KVQAKERHQETVGIIGVDSPPLGQSDQAGPVDPEEEQTHTGSHHDFGFAKDRLGRLRIVRGHQNCSRNAEGHHCWRRLPHRGWDGRADTKVTIGEMVSLPGWELVFPTLTYQSVRWSDARPMSWVHP